MVGLAARDLGSRSDSDLQGSGNLAGPQKQLPLAVLGNVAPMLEIRHIQSTPLPNTVKAAPTFLNTTLKLR